MTKYSREEKAERVKEWKGSGKSPWVYAKENGINPQTFTKWVKGHERPGFVEIRHEAGTGTAFSGNEIVIEKGELNIRLPVNMGIGEVCAVVQTVGGLL